MPGYAGTDPKALQLQQLWSAVFSRAAFIVKLPMASAERLLTKAYEGVELVAKELGWTHEQLVRRKEVNFTALH